MKKNNFTDKNSGNTPYQTQIASKHIMISKAASMKILWFLIVLISISTISVQAQNHDINILKEINLNRNKSLDPFFLAVTHSAGPLTFGLPLLLLIIGLLKRNNLLRSKSYYLIFSVLTSVIITNILKYSIDRPRPFVTYSFIEKVTAGGSPSFPSGHTSDAFVLAMALSLAFPKYWLIILSFIWAFLMGYSRMSLGVHYPADVLSGASIGIISAVVVYVLRRKKQQYNPQA